MSQALLLKDTPRYACFVDAAKEFPDLDPSAMHACVTLLHAQDVVSKRKGAQFAEYGITQGRFMVMIMLMKKVGEGCPKVYSPAEIAEQLQVTRASVTGLLDSLEKDRFVRREPDPNDRRMMSVHLTERGQAFLDDFLPPHFALISQLMAGLDVSERTTLVSLLKKLIAGLHVCQSES